MAMTQPQKKLVNRYLESVAARLSDMPPHERELIINEISKSIFAKFSGSVEPSNIDVQRYLARYGGVVKHAASIQELCIRENDSREDSHIDEFVDDAGPGPSSDSHVWLGVCHGIAERMGIPDWTVRLFFVLLGLSGPISLLVYLLLYTLMYNIQGSEKYTRVSLSKLLMHSTGAVFVIVVLCAGSQLILELAYYLFLSYTEHTSISLGKWGWFEAKGASIFICASLIVAPMAILSGLPMANGWDETFRKIVKAVIAIYAVVLSFGLASNLVGIIFQFVDHLTRKDLVI